MWYYANGDEEVGPISAKELKALAQEGTIGPDTQVWKEGMSDWKPATSVKGLLPAQSASVRDEFDEFENPYAPPKGRSGRSPRGRKNVDGKMTQLRIAGGLILGMAAITLVLAIIGNVVAPQQAPPQELQGPARQGFVAGQVGGVIAQVIFQIIAMIGGVAMIRGTSYSSAIAGTIVSFVPFCGPCLGLSIPFAIWAIILLMDPDVKAAFD